jgi:hypothetical protein
MKRDLKSSIDINASLPIATYTASGTGANVDLSGFDSAVIEFGVGTIATGGGFQGQLQHSLDGTTFGTAAAGDLLGTFLAVTTSNDPAVDRVGYIGTARYVRVVSLFTGTGAGGIVYANVIRGHASRQPI